MRILIIILCLCITAYAQDTVYTEDDLSLCQDEKLCTPDGEIVSGWLKTDFDDDHYMHMPMRGGLPVDGEVLMFHKESGTLARTISTKDGDINGLVHDYYENGKLKAKYNMVKGSFEGKQTEYYENGLLSHEIMYKKGQMNGAYKGYRSDGTLRLELTYQNDKAIKGECVQGRKRTSLTRAELINLDNGKGIECE